MRLSHAVDFHIILMSIISALIIFFLQELNAAMKKEVEATIALFLKKGQKSLISYAVKPEIMGGMVVSIGDRFVDMSTASKVKKYTEIIQAAA